MSDADRGKVLPAWAAILLVGLIVGLSMGRTQSMGLYMAPVTMALDTGRESFSLAMAVTQLLVGVGAPFSGALIDRFGAGKVIIVCVLAAAAGLWAMYSAHSANDLLVSGVLMGIGVSGTGVSSLVGTVGKLVPAERRLAAISSVGMAAGIGGFVSLPVMHLLIEVVGWKESLLYLIVITLSLIACAWPIRKRPEPRTDRHQQQSAREALVEAFRHPSFWLLTAGFFVCGFHVAFIMVHLPSFAIDQGLPAWVGPFALSAVGIANIVGTFIVGRSGGYIEKRRALSLIYVARALIFAGFLVLPMTPLTVIGLCTLLGLVWLATIPLTSSLVATFFGTAWMSMLFGIVFLSHQLGSFLGVWLAGRVFDLVKSYDAMWWISIALGLVSAVLNWPIAERSVDRPATTAASLPVSSSG